MFNSWYLCIFFCDRKEHDNAKKSDMGKYDFNWLFANCINVVVSLELHNKMTLHYCFNCSLSVNVIANFQLLIFLSSCRWPKQEERGWKYLLVYWGWPMDSWGEIQWQGWEWVLQFNITSRHFRKYKYHLYSRWKDFCAWSCTEGSVGQFTAWLQR